MEPGHKTKAQWENFPYARIGDGTAIAGFLQLPGKRGGL